MITVLKVQLPLNNSNPFAIYFNKDKTVSGFIYIERNKKLIRGIMGKNNLVSYCKCEVVNDKIINVIEHVTEKEFLEEK